MLQISVYLNNKMEDLVHFHSGYQFQHYQMVPTLGRGSHVPHIWRSKEQKRQDDLAVL